MKSRARLKACAYAKFDLIPSILSRYWAETRNVSIRQSCPCPGTILTCKQVKCKTFSWKMPITSLLIGRFYPKQYLTYILLLYMWIKYDSNTLIFSKYIERKLFFVLTDWTIKLKKGHNSHSNWWILPSIKRPIFYDHIPVYTIWIQYN